MAQKQSELARVLLKRPAVDTISSYMSGWNQHHAQQRSDAHKPGRQGQAGCGCGRADTTIATSVGARDRITMYMQPVQDLTIDARVSRTQYQLSAEDPNAANYPHKSVDSFARLQNEPQLSDVASDLQDRDSRCTSISTAMPPGRLGVTTPRSTNALYDATATAVSTIFTQSNLYRVVLEADPAISRIPIRSRISMCHGEWQQDPAIERGTECRNACRLSWSSHWANFHPRRSRSTSRKALHSGLTMMLILVSPSA